MPLYIQYPSWLHPEIIPGLPIRWYGLMYLVAFGITYLLFKRQLKERSIHVDEDSISGLFFWGILSLLVGARVFATLVYDTSGIYLRAPWRIFWPFDETGHFVGLQGMSYHGGVIGAIIGIAGYCRYKKWSIREIGDLLVAGIPLGYTFGRLGNFINGELYGRVTTAPIGMLFPQAERFPITEPWVREIVEELNLAVTSGYVNLPRHPSQLYEALFEGIILWLILWFLRNRRPFRGFLIGLYLIGYGLFRFVIEYFREPDADLGYRIQLVDTGLPPALFSSPFNLSTGQVLCMLMVIGGSIWLWLASRLPGRKPVTSSLQIDTSIAGSPSEKNRKGTETNRSKNEQRKLRKKLR
ncbi:MAG: prolipoprotein diacylglyceryl transferase [Treponemataceae bacterium]|nr:prolipoprotein diacylglyceryl transferase [Treponemataceae bacterium]